MKYKAIDPTDGKVKRNEYVEYYNDNRPLHVQDVVTIRALNKADPRNIDLLYKWSMTQKK